MSGVVAFEGELNAIVNEYLECNEFERTLSVFEKECTDKGKPVAPSDGRPKGNSKVFEAQGEMMRMFKDGDANGYFKLWEELLPKKIRNDDAVAQKLEFYLNIYFAIYPIKHNRGDAEAGMNRFKTYLETRGAALSQTTEFLPFYALPFVPNPKMHPSYKELFADKWIPDLKTRVEKFLTLALQATPQPRLFELYKGSGGERQIQLYEQRLQEAERKCSTYSKRANRVQGDYQNLIKITADLVDSLERTVQGDPVTPEFLQIICTRLFSNAIRQSVDLARPGTAGDLLRQSVVPPQGLQHKETQPGQNLDYAKIKADLTTAPERSRAFLLQALRWKLTKSAPPEREAMLQAFLQHDLLGCGSSGAYRRKLLELLEANDEVVRQYTARLFNAFASLCDGRTYLAQNADLMRALMDNLRHEDRDSLTRENVLGCLQKLSLRRHLQTIMIEEGVIAWLISVLEDNDSLSDYTLEYSVALLMNLCLRSAGKRKCTEHSHQILKVLSDLMGHENQEIIPYVNGTLYSILAIPSIREDAKALGMEDILKCFIKEDQPDMNRQIEFIIKQLSSTEEPDETESDDEDEEEDEEDADAMEADLDKQEALRAGQGELSGDRLLNSYYTSPVSGNVSARRRKMEGAQDEMFRRPVTPMQNKRGDQSTVYILRNRTPGGTEGQPDSARSLQSSHSRPSSRDRVNRPPTRSGASGRQERPPTIAEDGGTARALRPSTKALERLGDKGSDLNEYVQAFNARPKIPRTPAEGGPRPTSRGSVGGGPPPRPEYSEYLPTSRPGSGGRPSSNGGNKTPATPSGRSKPSSRGKLK